MFPRSDKRGPAFSSRDRGVKLADLEPWVQLLRRSLHWPRYGGDTVEIRSGASPRPFGSTRELRPRASSLTLDVGYRTVSASVDLDFVVQWLADHHNRTKSLGASAESMLPPAAGVVSGVSEALDALWPGYRAAARSSGVTYGSALDLDGCVDVGSTYADYNFWGFFGGGARIFHALMVQMAATYSAFVEDPFTGSPYSSGFGEFVRQQLLGEKTATADSTQKCRLMINYATKDAAFQGHKVDKPCSVFHFHCGEDRVAGESGYGELLREFGEGRKWDDWEWRWNLNTNTIENRLPGAALWWPNSPEMPEAFTLDRTIFMGPINLAYCGFLTDWIMVTAQVLWDFSRDTSRDFARRLAAATAASKVARYALRIVTAWSQTLIHELGHVWTSSTEGHCLNDRRCFGAVSAVYAEHRICAALGLPVWTWEPFTDAGPVESDFDPPTYRGTGFSLYTDDLVCGDDTSEGNVANTFLSWFRIGIALDVGRPGSDLLFCITTPCTSEQAFESESFDSQVETVCKWV